jgi:HEAT repeat protein
MRKTQHKTPIEKADEIFERNLVKAAETLISLLNSKDERVRMSATNAIIEKITSRPIILVVDKDNHLKRST